ncbi:MAG TPA: type IV toxin-antitoxin system AbiEi family antitoxin domain-containing protein [Solirubrobacteraceae bacterium]|nr:type IV toxin-antitoxin system AbiEi family antitoxin domain-containing protein [Solirubrobacteraceae bacterium]
MTAEDNPPHRDVVVGRLAQRQWGVVTARQLIGLGLSRGSIEHRVRIGRLVRLHRGVYAVGHSVLRTEGRWAAAVLACGPGAVLSHVSAASLWGIRATAASRVDVSGARTRAGHPGIALHRPRSLSAEDVTVRQAIPTTSVARTLLDLAAVLTARDLERTLAQAELLGLVDRRALAATIARANGHRGAAILARALAAGVDATASELEWRFLTLCRRSGLPEPRVNQWLTLGGGEEIKVDFLWPSDRLVVETDGYRFHRGRLAFESDRARDARLTVAGYRVVRVTQRQLESPEAVIDTLSRLLA